MNKIPYFLGITLLILGIFCGSLINGINNQLITSFIGMIIIISCIRGILYLVRKLKNIEQTK